METKDIKFNADDLVGSVEAFARHLTGKQKLTLRTATIPHVEIRARSANFTV
jgi:hypothetical protein